MEALHLAFLALDLVEQVKDIDLEITGRHADAVDLKHLGLDALNQVNLGHQAGSQRLLDCRQLLLLLMPLDIAMGRRKTGLIPAILPKQRSTGSVT